MSAPIRRFRPVDSRDVRVLLCDADGNLFPSEEPAFAASTEVMNRLMAHLGVPVSFAAEDLRIAAAGRNFRANAVDLALAQGVNLGADELERWVLEEQRAVIAHLGAVLRPDGDVIEPVTELARRFGLAVVSSSARARLDACFAATALEGLFPAERRFSAEDSLPVPTSKPDPAVYVFAGERLGVSGRQAVAIEDSVAGARSALGAGFPTIGNVAFVPTQEREERIEELREAGVVAVISSWGQLGDLLPAALGARP